MHKQFTTQIQTYLISLFLLGCGSEIQREGLVEGEILDLDSFSVTLLLEDRGWFSKSEELSIPLRNESDSLWLAKGMSVRAELRLNDNRLALQSVWPADPAVESKLIKPTNCFVATLSIAVKKHFAKSVKRFLNSPSTIKTATS